MRPRPRKNADGFASPESRARAQIRLSQRHRKAAVDQPETTEMRGRRLVIRLAHVPETKSYQAIRLAPAPLRESRAAPERSRRTSLPDAAAPHMPAQPTQTCRHSIP